MRKSMFKKSLAGALALTLGVVPTTALMAQNAGSPGIYRYSFGGFNPSQFRRNITLAPGVAANARAPQVRRSTIPAPRFAANASASGTPISVGPASGPIGARLQVTTNGNLGGTPIFVTFWYPVYGSARAAFSTRLQGTGSSFSAAVPRQLCMYGVRTWNVDVKLSNLREFHQLGTFSPTNCPR